MTVRYNFSVEDHARFLAERSPLPTAEELAGPLVTAFTAIQETFDGRSGHLDCLTEFGDPELRDDYIRQAHELVNTAQRLKRIVGNSLVGMIPGGDPGVAAVFRGAIATILHTMTDTALLDNSLNDCWGDVIDWSKIPQA